MARHKHIRRQKLFCCLPASYENLKGMTDTYVNKLLFDGKKAVGIEAENRKTKTVKLTRELFAQNAFKESAEKASPQSTTFKPTKDRRVVDHAKHRGWQHDRASRSWASQRRRRTQ
jgi:hypothetical protein